MKEHKFTKRFAAHAMVFNCSEDMLLRMINNCGSFVEKIYIAYSEYPWIHNPEARNRYKNNTDLNTLKKSAYYYKIEFIFGEWNTDMEERATCLAKAKNDGFDYLIIQDADEFYSFEDLEKNLIEIEKNPDYDIYETPWMCFWKSTDYVLTNRKNSPIVGFPEFAVNCKSGVASVRTRTVQDSVYRLSGLCYHLSYVLSDEDVYSKIKTWGHTAQFNNEKWYKEKWLQWNLYTRNLHPVSPREWKIATKFDGQLPEVLIDFKSPQVTMFNNSLFDKIKKRLFDEFYSYNFKRIALGIGKKFGISKEKVKIIYYKLRATYLFPIYQFRRFRSMFTWRSKASKLKNSTRGLQLHLGCGGNKLEGFLNCEFRATEAADLVMDCGKLSRFKDNSVSTVFSHAFFEHLYRKQQVPLLKDCFRILKDNGSVVFLGLSDFEVYAQAYIDKNPGIASEVFDLFDLYRHSHGDPEMGIGYWLEQLHKSLFDKQYVEDLLRKSGFEHFKIFNYAYPGEQIPLSLGFVATKDKKEEPEIINILAPFKNNIKNLDQITFYN